MKSVPLPAQTAVRAVAFVPEERAALKIAHYSRPKSGPYERKPYSRLVKLHATCHAQLKPSSLLRVQLFALQVVLIRWVTQWSTNENFNILCKTASETHSFSVLTRQVPASAEQYLEDIFGNGQGCPLSPAGLLTTR